MPSQAQGGVIGLYREHGCVTCTCVEHSFDGFLWLQVAIEGNSPLWAGGAYIPGPSDTRFRSLQEDGLCDHFQSLSDQLLHKSASVWVLGGDLNSVTHCMQADGGFEDPLDSDASLSAMPVLSTHDMRRVNAHGRRLLQAIADKA